jgi:cell division septation protein DedD
VADEGAAAALSGKLRSEGYPARVRAYRANGGADGGLRYAVDVIGLGSAEDAAQMAAALRKAGYPTEG